MAACNDNLEDEETDEPIPSFFAFMVRPSRPLHNSVNRKSRAVSHTTMPPRRRSARHAANHGDEMEAQQQGQAEGAAQQTEAAFLANLPLETRQQVLEYLLGSQDMASARRAASTCRSIRAAYVSLLVWRRIADAEGWKPRSKSAPPDALFTIAKLQSKDLHVCEKCLAAAKESYAVEISKDIFKRFCLACVKTVWNEHAFVRETSLASQEWIDANAAPGGYHSTLLAREDVPHRVSFATL